MMDGKKVIPVKGVMQSRVSDRLYLLEPKSGTYYELNPTGSLAWEWFRQEGNRPMELAAQLAEHYEVTLETARTDLEALLRDLAAKGLIRIEDESD